MDYEYSTNDPAAVAAIMGPIWLVSLVLAVIGIVALWKIFTKAGEPGWAAIIPFYNVYTEFKIAGLNPWLFLLMFVPVANIIAGIWVALKIGERFGKDLLWSILLLVIIPVGWLILGFGKATYAPAPAGYAAPAPMQ